MNTLVARARATLPSPEELGYWTLTFLAYLLTAKLGQFLLIGLGTSPAFIWPPAGIALAAMFLWGYRMWSAVALAAFVAGASTPTAAASIIAATTIGSTLQALAGAFVFRWFEFRPNISRLRDTLLLIATALTVTMITPTIVLVTRLTIGPATEMMYDAWRIVWSGNILSVLVLTPLIIGFAQDLRMYRDRLIEQGVALVLLSVITYFIFWERIGSIGSIPLLYFLLVPFFWIALRFSPRSTALALFVTSCIAIGGAVLFPPETTPLGQWLFQTELFLQIFALIFLIVSSAVEDRRAAADELRTHVDRLESAVSKISEEDTAKSEFLAVLAHELRNPLAPVLSTLELLRMRRTPSDEEAVLLAGAEQRLHMMGRLLDDLLDISRISEKRLKMRKEYVSLGSIVERSVEGAQPLIDKYKHSFSMSMPPESLVLYADPIRIEQVLVNVLNNAAKYTPERGEISLTVERIAARVHITISDNGTGIDSKMLARIFEPFLQVSHTKFGTSGIGVGLALAKELVSLHDGTIRAKSDGLGTGSSFEIEFPLVASKPTPEPEQKPAAPAGDRTVKPLTVLIVDDNQAGAEALGRLLSFRGHRTVLAYDGLSGVDRAIQENPDAILLDIGLPDIDGYEVARRLRSAGNASFLIALTGYGQDDDRKKALEAGCDAHLVKPVGLSDIESVLMSRFLA